MFYTALKHQAARSLAALLMVCATSGSAQPESPKVGLALSGGGARGAAHVGVLKVLEDLGVRVDYIAGTSMGSAVGGLFASGYSASEIEVLLGNVDWEQAFSDGSIREDRPFRRKQDDNGFLVKSRLGLNDGQVEFPLGLIQGQHLEQVLGQLIAPTVDITDFDELPIPFRAVATDLATGKAKVIGEGNLGSAIRASMSVPGVFAPVISDGHVLVDGGLAQNLPVETVKEMGADIVIAVDISTPLLEREELDSVLAITEQLTSLLTVGNAKESQALLTEKDILIIPDLEGISSASFDAVLDAVPRGEIAAGLHREELTRIAALAPAHHNTMTAARLLFPRKPVISFIDIENDSRLSDQVLLSRLDLALNQPLDRVALDRAVDHLYGLDVFQKVSYELVKRDGETGLKIIAQEKAWGPNYLQFGLALNDNFSGGDDYSLGVAYTRTALNELGGEARFEFNLGRRLGLIADWYQPLNPQDRYFVNPSLVFGRTDNRVFDNSNNQIGEAQFSIFSTGVDVGVHNDSQQLSLGVDVGRVKIEQLSGFVPEPAIGRFDLGELSLRYEYDSFDSAYFPTSGFSGGFAWQSGQSFLGGDDDYDLITIQAGKALTRNDNTFIAGIELGTTLDENAPIYRQFDLGGFSRLSGLQEDQLSGQHLVLGNVGYYRRFRELAAIPLYAGATLEWGNVWQNRDDVSLSSGLFGASVFVGADTVIGPFYLGYGVTEGMQDSLFMFLGNPFIGGR